MRYVAHYVIILMCSFGLVGCLTASNKQVRFSCDDSVMPTNLEKKITVIAQAHHFFPAPPEKAGLRFYSNMKSSPSLYAVVSSSRAPEFILGISVMRSPGSEDKLPPEVLVIFDAIVHEVNTHYVKNCILLD